MGVPAVNMSELGRILGETRCLVEVHWSEELREATSDVMSGRVDLYEVNRDDMPVRTDDSLRVKVGVDARAIVMVRNTGSRGALLDIFIREVRSAAELTFKTHVLRRLVKKIDFALFAMEHDGGHGLEVISGIKEMWAQAGAEQWAYRAKQREAVIAWLAEAP